MSDEKVFSEGLYFNLPGDRAPDFIKGSISVELAKFGPWAAKHAKDGKVRLNLKVGKSGKAYAELDQWEPKERTREKDGYELSTRTPTDAAYSPKDMDDEIPF